MAVWPFLVVLNLYEFTARCRSCRWVSAPQTTVAAARQAFQAHHCPGSPVCSPLVEGPREVAA